MGNGSVIRPGDVQRMSAGTGVRHSEFNASDTDPVHFLQIWVLPDRASREPGYEQKHFAAGDKQGRLRLVASGDGRDGSVSMNQDADLYATVLKPGDAVSHDLPAESPRRHLRCVGPQLGRIVERDRLHRGAPGGLFAHDLERRAR